ncbi:unnamed protein product [Adineta steineri]|uniref:Uncharacterized protein n=1 Tax=Adineta steineri TaxID=433720 RepID=A0A814MXU8_9BILA|nr:unnamed protein product [Adineta steineri]CAF3484646.1 unnamed protein product [Adineta steineri]
MWRFFVELLSYLSFVCVICLIAFLNRSPTEYLQKQYLRQLFVNPNSATLNFEQITTITQYWNWLEESFVNNIVAETWYNGQPDNTSQGYIIDKTNRLVGWATMRQLRIKPDTCKVKSTIKSLIPICYDDYSASIEDKRSFLPGWITNTTIGNYSSPIGNYSSTVNQAYIYKTSEQLDTYVYVGELATYRSGGYVYEFRGALSELRNDLFQLHELGWIDVQTRAILIQLNLYNPVEPLLTSVTIVFELLSSSGGVPSAQFQPLNLYIFKTVFQIVCICIYFIFIIYLMISHIITLIRNKKLYFRQVWSYIELGIIVCSWSEVGIQIWRVNEAARIASLFHETHGNTYINFQLLAYVNDFYLFFLGFCCFFGTLRLLRLCRYNQRINLLALTLKRAARELLSFSMMFAIIFIAFLMLYYFQFCSAIWECSSLLHTAQMLFELLLLKFDATQIKEAAPVLGPLYFTFFIIFVVFICINMFVSIVNDNFRRIQIDLMNVHSDYHGLLHSLRRKVEKVFGIKPTNVVSIDETQNPKKKIEMTDSFKRLSNRLDKLNHFVIKNYSQKKNVRMVWNEKSIKT